MGLSKQHECRLKQRNQLGIVQYTKVALKKPEQYHRVVHSNVMNVCYCNCL